jgi:hypothetical protein
LIGSTDICAGSSNFGAGFITNAVFNFAGEASLSFSRVGDEAVGGPLNLSAAHAGRDVIFGDALGEALMPSLESERLSRLGPKGDCDVFRGDPGCGILSGDPGREIGFVRST